MIDRLELSYELIRQFLVNSDLLAEHHSFVNTVQQRGNAIHAFTSRDLGTGEEYLEHIALYRDFLFDLDSSLPKP